MKKLIIFCIALFLASSCFGTTYNIGPGQTYETFAALTSSVTLGSDDIVDGGGNTFRETWEPNGSGTSGHSVILRNATISGADIITGFSGPDGNGEYYKALPIQCRVVLSDGDMLDMGTVGSLESDEWDWDGDVLYLGFNPSGKTIEAGQRQGLVINGRSYIDVEDIVAECGQIPENNNFTYPTGSFSVYDSSYINLSDVSAKNSNGYGFQISGSSNVVLADWSSENVNSYDVGTSGDHVHIRHTPDDTESDTIEISNGEISGYTDRGGIVNVGGHNISILYNNLGYNYIDFEPLSPRECNGSEIIGNYHVSNVQLVSSVDGSITNVNMIGNEIDCQSRDMHPLMTNKSLGGTSYIERNNFKNLDGLDTDNYSLELKFGSSGTFYFRNNIIHPVSSGHWNFISYSDGGTIYIENNLILGGGNYIGRLDGSSTVAYFTGNSCYDYNYRGLYYDDGDWTIEDNQFYANDSASFHIFGIGGATDLTCNDNYYYPIDLLWRYNGTNRTWEEWQGLGFDTYE